MRWQASSSIGAKAAVTASQRQLSGCQACPILMPFVDRYHARARVRWAMSALPRLRRRRPLAAHSTLPLTARCTDIFATQLSRPNATAVLQSCASAALRSLL